MGYIKQYQTKTDFVIFYQDGNETKMVPQGLDSPKVIKWLAEGNQFEVVEWVVPDLAETKIMLLANAKSLIDSELVKTDYKIIRQLERKEAGKTPKLSVSEFTALSDQRQALRDKLNAYEIEIGKANSYEVAIGVNL